MTAAVTFDGVTKIYGAFNAVADVSFTLTPGTLTTLLGPSGCGKTTTLRLIAGLEHATTGRITIDGVDVTRLSATERDVSMVFQSYALFPHMTVLENVCYGLRAGGMGRSQAEAKAADKIAIVGLSGLERRLPSELSGGQQQRVAVARAIVLEPKVLLFDEPLSNLDAKLRRHVRDEIRTLQQKLKLTVVYVTHDQQEALAVSDRIIVMNGGRIAQDGGPRDLYERPSSRFIADFIGDANLVPAEFTAAGLQIGSGMLKIDLGGNGKVLLAIRPHAIRLGSGQLRGRVLKRSYLGDHMEYDISFNDLEVPLFVIDSNTDAFYEVGEYINIEFSIKDIISIKER